MEVSRLEASKHRMCKAERNLESAKLMCERGMLEGAVDRSYFAVFHAMHSLASLDGFMSVKHSGIIIYFNNNYVKTGIFDISLSKIISAIFRVMECVNYEAFYEPQTEEAQEYINGAEKVISDIRKYLLSKWPEISKEEQSIMNAIFTRTSTRQFTADKVESKYIIKILRAAMAAPSAVNQQPWEFWVSDDPEINGRLSQVTPYATPAKNAPVVIIPCYRTNDLRASVMVDIDMAICAENILLEAEELGLGAVMLGIAPLEENMKKVEEILHIPENFRAFMLIPIGYPVSKRPQEDRYEPAKIHTV